MNCSFNTGDSVEFNGQCFPVIGKHKLGAGWILRLQAANGASFPVDCAMVSACAQVATRAMQLGGPVAGLPPRPDGLEQIIQAFGDPRLFAEQKNTWEAISMEHRVLALPLDYAYKPNTPIHGVRAHKLVVDHLSLTLAECFAKGVTSQRLKYGGCYQWRSKRTAAELSTHTWGIAVDIEPAENPIGEAWEDDGIRMDPRVVEIFEARGWLWGGRFAGNPDPMHFQWASGY